MNSRTLNLPRIGLFLTLLTLQMVVGLAPRPALAWRAHTCADTQPGVRETVEVWINQCWFPPSDERDDIYWAFDVWNRIPGALRRFDLSHPGGVDCNRDVRVREGRVAVLRSNGLSVAPTVAVGDVADQGAMMEVRARTRLGCARGPEGDPFRGRITGAVVTMFSGNSYVAAARRGPTACTDHIDERARLSIRSMVAHEVGHIMGLNHAIHHVNALMHPDFSTNSPGPLYCADTYRTALRDEQGPAIDELAFVARFHTRGHPPEQVRLGPGLFSESMSWHHEARRDDGGGHIVHLVGSLVDPAASRTVPREVCVGPTGELPVEDRLPWAATFDQIGVSALGSRVELHVQLWHVATRTLYAQSTAVRFALSPGTGTNQYSLTSSHLRPGTVDRVDFPRLGRLPLIPVCGEVYDVSVVPVLSPARDSDIAGAVGQVALHRIRAAAWCECRPRLLTFLQTDFLRRLLRWIRGSS